MEREWKGIVSGRSIDKPIAGVNAKPMAMVHLGQRVGLASSLGEIPEKGVHVGRISDGPHSGKLVYAVGPHYIFHLTQQPNGGIEVILVPNAKGAEPEKRYIRLKKAAELELKFSDFHAGTELSSEVVNHLSSLIVKKQEQPRGP